MSKHKINKQDAITFQLLHRSQQDPLIADEDAPQRVLVPVKSKDSKKNDQHFPKQEHNELEEDGNHVTGAEYDDTSEPNQKAPKKIKFKLPSVVFPSEVEEEVGMLGKAAPVSGPQLHLDPDVIAALDDDFDYSDPENQLEDNFIELANSSNPNQEYDSDEYSFNEEDEDKFSFEEDEFAKEETKSRFTNYSITSSAIRRNDKLRLLDNKFEQMYIGYDENEIGALDLEEIEGPSVLLDSALEEFHQSQNSSKLEQANITSKIQESLVNMDEEEDNELVPVSDIKHKWDCESILSSYSNIYNHPRLIMEPKKDKIQINKKTGIPNVFNESTLTSKTLDELNQQNSTSLDDQKANSHFSLLSTRSKNESSEERKLRKQKLREYRKERRIEKKINSLAFKDESKKQIKIVQNNRNNVQGNKLL